MILVKGPPESGKSELAEEIFEGLPSKVYFATLPRVVGNLERIRRHQRLRRAKGWDTLEYSERMRLGVQLERASRSEGLLVDGLLPLLIRQTIVAAAPGGDLVSLIPKVVGCTFEELWGTARSRSLAVIVFSDRAWSGDSAMRRLAMDVWMKEYVRKFPFVVRFLADRGQEVLCPESAADRLRDRFGSDVSPVSTVQIVAEWSTDSAPGPSRDARNDLGSWKGGDPRAQRSRK